MNEKQVLDVFKAAGLEVTLIHDTDAVPTESQEPISCVYKGRRRVTSLEACSWHHDHVDTSCEGCSRVIQKQAQTTQQTQTPQVQHKLFT